MVFGSVILFWVFLAIIFVSGAELIIGDFDE
jgi:hypothetical protein